MKFQGIPPKAPSAILASATINGIPWQLWERFGEHKGSDVWRSLKLITPGPRHKANYWLGWNTSADRFASVKDYHTLATHDADVLAWVQLVLTDDATARLLYSS
jgi:hypothetical protein